MNYDETEKNNEERDEIEEKKQRRQNTITKWRIIVGFWILGLTNNFGYVVILTAAMDIIKKTTQGQARARAEELVRSTYIRDCNPIPTGGVLIAQILPGILVKLIVLFIPLWIKFRVIFCFVCTILGFLVVSIAEIFSLAVVGIVFVCIASELGETTFLQLLTFYSEHGISGWSSGTGAAGLLGAGALAALIRLVGLKVTFWIMVIVPIAFITSYLLLPKPNRDSTIKEVPLKSDDDKLGFKDRMIKRAKSLRRISMYVIPLAMVYMSEYLINQGLYELMFFKNSSMDHTEQYRIYQILYQLGVFLSRSSLQLFKFRWIWLLMIFQIVIFLFFFIDAWFYIVPYIYIDFIFCLIEGFIGGLSYVNNFNNINTELEETDRLFAAPLSALLNTIAITISGGLSFPIHSKICRVPEYKRVGT